MSRGIRWKSPVQGKLSSTAFGGSNIPLVELNHSSDFTFRGSLTGVSTQSCFYDSIGGAVTKQFTQNLKQQLDQVTRKSSPLPVLPDAFYPAYVEASNVPPLERRSCHIANHTPSGRHNKLRPKAMIPQSVFLIPREKKSA
ncbi:MAG: hypothetical protein FWC50_12915 [Planctomycetaceae bacterium]|nr:hypothetical protein [Planctomycetaceae bacterium]